jgi:Uma2 family endonuclease
MNDQAGLWDYQRPLRLTVDEFFHLADAGAFARFTRTELIDGEVLTMNAQYSSHAQIKAALSLALGKWVESKLPDCVVLTEATVRIEPDSAPEPDILITSFTKIVNEPIPANSVRLVAEVAASTLNMDLGRKARLYATAGIAEYWVADVENRLVRQFWAPDGGAYTQRREIPFGQPIEAATIAGLVVPTTRLG